MDGQLSRDASTADAQVVDAGPIGPDANPGCTTRLGAVAWWRGEGNADDSAGNHDGMAMTGVGYEEGEVGMAFRFNGSTGVSVPDASETFRFAGPFSVEMWVKRETIVGESPAEVFVGKDQCPSALPCSNDPGSRWLLGLSATTIYPRFLINSNSGGEDLSAMREIIVPDEAFHHLVATYTGSAMLIYVDGDKTTFDSIVAENFANAASALPLYIGKHASGEGFNGWIDEVVYYNRALTDAEVTMLYLSDCIL